MEDPPDKFLSDILWRIEWCRVKRQQAPTPEEEEGWLAEAVGLIDALLGLDRTESWNNSHPTLVERYELGLADGQTLMNLLQSSNRAAET